MIVAETNLESIPEKCGECPLFVQEHSDYGYCLLIFESIDNEKKEYRLPECPLKEVPDNAIH